MTLCVTSYDMRRKTWHYFCVFLTKNAWPEFNHQGTSDKSKLGGILQNNGPFFFNYVNVRKDKKWMSNYLTLEEIYETWQLNAIWITGLSNLDNWQLNKVCRLFNSVVSLLLSIRVKQTIKFCARTFSSFWNFLYV